MANRNGWQTIQIHPLSNILDTRSRPADIPPGAFRWKEAFAVNSEGKMCRRTGFRRFFSDYLYDSNGVLLTDPSHGAGSNYHNHDLHHQGDTREPITFQFESTDNAGTRRFFAGTQSRLYQLDQATGEYTTIASGKGATGSVWKAAELQDVIIFTNDVDPVQQYALPSGPIGNVASLISLSVTTAKTVVMFEGFIMVMNVVEGGNRKSSRIWWSDLNDPTAFSNGGTLSAFQDLDYGDDIIAAAPLLGSLYIFTRRSIWKCTVAGDASLVFAFAKVYTEPKNQTGCLAYQNSLVSDGSNFWYMSTDGIYRYNPYIAAPERDDWMHRADGVIYKKLDTMLDSSFCQSPIMQYKPADRELWISWPTIGVDGINNLTLVAQTEQKTADVLRVGFTSMTNFRRTPASEEQCNETQDLVAACGLDWCLKSIGNVFFYEYAELDSSGVVTDDLPDEGEQYVQVGYNSIIRGLIPTGLFDRDKLVKNVFVSDDTADQDTPCLLQCRIGNAYQNVDPNDTADHCSPLWRKLKDKALTCSNTMKLTEMAAKNIRPNVGKDFQCYEQGRYLYFEFTIVNFDGGPAIGGNACFQEFNFDVMAMPKV